MRRGPRRAGSFFSPELRIGLALAGLAVGLAATAAYIAGRALAPEAAQTMAFATIAAAELAFVFSVRSPRTPAWQGPRNRALTAGVLASAAVLTAAIYIPPLREPFGTVALGWPELASVVPLALLPAALVEGAKALRRRGPADRGDAAP